jgi:hypothetical protein
MRLRKPLEQALRSRALRESIGSRAALEGKGDQKIIEIKIEQGFGLSITGTGPSQKPFFSYDFYTFETKSVTAQGTNPVFDSSSK